MIDYNGIVSSIAIEIVSNVQKCIKFESNSLKVNEKELQLITNEITNLIILINKIKKLTNKIKEFNTVLEKNKKLDYIQIEMDKLIVKAKSELLNSTKLVDFRTKKINFVQSEIDVIDLINYTIGFSSNFASPPNNDGKFIPKTYKYPFPFVEDMSTTLLNMDLNESSRLKPPRIMPLDEKTVKEGTPIELDYPYSSDKKGIFFKYTTNISHQNQIPSFFNGEKYSKNNKPKVTYGLIFKACCCKIGVMDSPIVTFRYNSVFYEDNDEIVNEVIMDHNQNGIERIERPMFIIGHQFNMMRPPTIPVEDGSSLNTSNPGSMHQLSIHIR